MSHKFISADLVRVYNQKEKKDAKLIAVLAWGDTVKVIQQASTFIKIELDGFKELADGNLQPIKRTGYIHRPKKQDHEIVKDLPKDVLMVSFVDVQQGDGCIIETPDGKVIIIDGGQNQMFARYLAARYNGSSPENPKVIDCIVVSHGDADHFQGLPEILESETNSNPRKRIFIKPLRVYHNGLVKRPGKKPDDTKYKDTELLGKTDSIGDQLYVTELYQNLINVPSERMNKPFNLWKNALKEYWDFYGEFEIKQIDHTSQEAFSFLNDIEVEVLGPFTENVNGRKGLKFLKTPPKSAARSLRSESKGSYSASHTINGHSIILRMKYGNIRFFFAGDLNEEAEDLLVERSKKGQQSIRSEILKVPHHGSGDFSNDFLEAVNPLASIVSSGDESELVEYIHPRATLVGALGKYSSVDRPLVFVTEMVAFLKKEGMSELVNSKSKKPFYAFSRSAFGIVHVRTDGERVLIFTHSGKEEMKEAYAYIIRDENTAPQRDQVIII